MLVKFFPITPILCLPLIEELTFAYIGMLEDLLKTTLKLKLPTDQLPCKSTNKQTMQLEDFLKT
jgi:hypothetical protein